MMNLETNDKQSIDIQAANQTSFASDLIRRLAYKGLLASDSLEPEEITQSCMAILVHINNRGSLDL